MRMIGRHIWALPVAALPLLLVLYFVVYAALLGNPGFSVDKTQHGLHISKITEQLNPVQVDDRIVAVNGIPYEQMLGDLFIRSSDLSKNTVTAVRNAEQFTFTLRTKPYSLKSVLSHIWLHLLLITVFLSLAFVALFRAPYSKQTVLFFIMLSGFSGSLASTLASQLGLFVPPVMAVSFYGIACCNWLGFGAWAHFACCFPEERDITRTRPWLAPLLYILPPTLTIILSLLFADPSTEFWCWVQRLRNMFLPLIIVGAFVKHLIDFFQLPLNITRNQIKFPLAAYWLSFGPYFFLYLLPNLLFDHPLAYFRTVALAFLILPLAYLFALIRYRLLAVDKVLSRILSSIILVILLTALYVAFLLVVKRWLWGAGMLSEELFLLFLVMVIVGFNPALVRLQALINRYIFGNTPLPPSLLHSLSRRISNVLVIDDLIPIVTREFQEQFGLTKVAIVLAAENRMLVYPEEYRETVPGSDIVRRMIDQMGENEEYFFCRRLPESAPFAYEIDQLGQAGWSMVFLLKGSNTNPGFFLIGEKENRRIFNEDDIVFLSTFANNVGVALENSFRFTSLADSTRQQQVLFKKMLQQSKMAAIGEMSTVLAHELKNPLAVIHSSAQLLRTTSPAPEIEEEMLSFIIEEVDSLNLTINSLLTHARHRAPVLHGVELQKAIPQLLEKWRLSVDHHPGVEITCAIPDRMPILNVDISQLGQVLLNVIRNSEEAIGESGKITVSVREKEEQAELIVRDNGPGIPEDRLDKLFHHFRSTKKRGLGLGLVVCRQLIEAHNGTFTISNRQCGGVKVIICLPYHSELSDISADNTLEKQVTYEQ